MEAGKWVAFQKKIKKFKTSPSQTGETCTSCSSNSSSEGRRGGAILTTGGGLGEGGAWGTSRADGEEAAAFSFIGVGMLLPLLLLLRWILLSETMIMDLLKATMICPLVFLPRMVPRSGSMLLPGSSKNWRIGAPSGV